MYVSSRCIYLPFKKLKRAAKMPRIFFIYNRTADFLILFATAELIPPVPSLTDGIPGGDQTGLQP
jgi:hypothetical protein